jgi:hypothetical protein
MPSYGDLAFENPLRGNLNRLYRRGVSPAEAVAILSATAKLPKGAPRDSKLARLSKSETAALRAFVKSGQAKSSVKGRSKSKREWSNAVLTGLGGSYNKKGTRSTLRGSHASRYRFKAKKSQKQQKWKDGTRTINIVNVDAVRGAAATRGANRASGKFGANKSGGMRGHGYPGGPGAIFGGRKSKKAKSGGRVKQSARKASPAFLAAGAERRALVAAAKAAGIQGAGKMKSAELKTALGNPGSALYPLSGLAFTNPGSALYPVHNPAMGVKAYFLGYALPVTVAGAVAGGVHAFASTSGLTGKISDGLGMIPGVGEYLADNLAFTVQGVVLGGGLGLVGGMVGGQAGRWIALAGGATLVAGGVIDAFNYALGLSEGASEDEDDADLDISTDLEAAPGASTGDLGFNVGDLAFTNGMGAFGNLGDGFAWETAPLTAGGGADYGQASMLDAQYCGADFSGVEGSALVNGRGAFIRHFGPPSTRAGSVSQDLPSHLAGKEGHRWGWLVKLVGWQRAQVIAGLQPQQRIHVIRTLRQKAIEAFRALRLEAQSSRVPGTAAPASAAGMAPQGATGVSGPTSSNGAELNFLGEPALFTGV